MRPGQTLRGPPGTRSSGPAGRWTGRWWWRHPQQRGAQAPRRRRLRVATGETSAGGEEQGRPEVVGDEPIERVAVMGQSDHCRAERPGGGEERRRAQVAPPEVAVSVAGELGMVDLAGGDGGDDRGAAAERATGSERKVERDVECAARQRRADRGSRSRASSARVRWVRRSGIAASSSSLVADDGAARCEVRGLGAKDEPRWRDGIRGRVPPAAVAVNPLAALGVRPAGARW